MVTIARRAFALLLCAVLGFGGCRRAARSSSERAGPIDACNLMTKEEVGAVQGTTITETKSSVQANAGFRAAQCFYTGKEFSKSVVLTVTQRDPEQPGNRTPKDFWNDTFHRETNEEKEREGERGEEGEKPSGPTKIAGVGDEAFWTGARFGGALYALKKDIFIRISVGGNETEQGKIDHSKRLALKALERL